MTAFDDNVTDVQEFIDSDRFSDITRLYSARQVAEQRGTIASRLPRRPGERRGVLRASA